MKKSVIFVLFFVWMGHAQVGINTVTPNAQLDIRSSNQVAPSNTDGILIPKIDQFPATNPTAAQQGMLVYLTILSGTDLPGFYYWDNPTVKWIPIGNNNNSGWNLTGNTGTNPAVNFIGTTDNQDVIFKRNNVFAGKIAISNISLGMNSGNASTGFYNTYIGEEAGKNTVTGSQNVMIGGLAGFFGDSGTSNVLVGFAAGQLNSGGQNTFIGPFTGGGNTTGTNNSFLGVSSGSLTSTGFNNTFIGAFSGENNITGTQNTILGNEADVANSNLTNATAIGSRAQVNTSNSLVLGSVNGANGATSSVNVGIGTTTPLDRLHVAGNIRMVDGNQAAGRVLTSDANGTASWTNPIGATNGTLDEAYDFGGAGLGKTITADAGAVLINGTDGLVSTGTIGSGAIAPSGAGTRMVWNPRKAAFRAGSTSTTQWDNVNVGTGSIALGSNTIASGPLSTAFGTNTTASGINSTAFGYGNAASGSYSTAFGDNTTASGMHSTAFGGSNTAPSFGETVLGIGATQYTPSTNGSSQFRIANATDRLFVVGNAIDANSTGSVDFAERSDALIILKNGLTRLPSTTNAMITAADGKAVVTKEYLQSNTSGTLDQAYDFGGAGLGKTITADAGAVLINGTDGLVSTGTSGLGAIVPSGAGIRMVWNPRTRAFRAGGVSGAQWDTINVGFGSFAFGNDTTAIGTYSMAFGFNTTATAFYSTAFGVGTTASESRSTAFGAGTTASEINATAFGNDTTADGTNSTAFGQNSTANATNSTAFGQDTTASGFSSTAFGQDTTANGTNSTAFGKQNNAKSHSETVFGIGATDYTPSANSNTQFRIANATDRLLVVGNAIDLNANNIVDATERSDALVILKNGNTGIGTSTPTQNLEISGPAGLTTTRITNTSATGITANVALDFYRRTNANTDWRIFNIGPYLTIGNSLDDLATVNELYQYQAARFMPMNDATQSLGQGTNRWNTLFASNGTINTSDAREKKNIQNLNYGLTTLMQLRPVSFEWKKNDGSGTKLGLIAQDLQQVIPEVVRDWDWEEDEQGNRKKVSSPILGVYYSDLIPVLIKATQDQQVIIEKQKEENLELKKQLEIQNEKLTNILKRLEKIEGNNN